MTKIFCDICGREKVERGEDKVYDIGYYSKEEAIELEDVCPTCQSWLDGAIKDAIKSIRGNNAR